MGVYELINCRNEHTVDFYDSPITAMVAVNRFQQNIEWIRGGKVEDESEVNFWVGYINNRECYRIQGLYVISRGLFLFCEDELSIDLLHELEKQWGSKWE